MKNAKMFALIVGLVAVMFSCASNDNMEPEARELNGTVKPEVLEHKGTALGINELPVWVETYVQKGIPGLEKLSDFNDEYCFVAETTATNLEAAQVWLSGFNMPQLIARNVSTRVEGLFTGAASGSADGAYSTYFEDIVKASSEITYSGVQKQNDWWVLVRRYEDNSKKKYSDEYHVYMLSTIKKDLLDTQVLDVIEDTANASESTEEQNAAINKVKELVKSEGLSD